MTDIVTGNKKKRKMKRGKGRSYLKVARATAVFLCRDFFLCACGKHACPIYIFFTSVLLIETVCWHWLEIMLVAKALQQERL